MNIVKTLNEKLLRQDFTGAEPDALMDALGIAEMYSVTENSVSVLSDLKANRSYIFRGGAAEGLGLMVKEREKTIETIWEEELFARIYPDDLINKYKLELRFFNLLRSVAVEERRDYHIASRLRIRDGGGQYRDIFHRMFYLSSSANGSLWLALCLYNHTYDGQSGENYSGAIINSATGGIVRPEETPDVLLSGREKEVLRLVRQGRLSKEIADALCISKNTVNRHRQNILDKLCVKNSIEACRLAEMLNLI